jgi:hypothetical protein
MTWPTGETLALVVAASRARTRAAKRVFDPFSL